MIGLDCETGNVDDCNDGPDQSASSNITKSLILSDKESKCGSKCSVDERARSSAVKSKVWWTHWISQALESLTVGQKTLIQSLWYSR